MFSKLLLAFDVEDGGVEMHQELTVPRMDQSEVTLEEVRLKVLPRSVAHARGIRTKALDPRWNEFEGLGRMHLTIYFEGC
jgi:hypothetical protein